MNRPLGITFAAGGAVTVRWPGQVHARRYRSRRCTIRVRCTCQSICSLPSDPNAVNAAPQSGQTR